MEEKFHLRWINPFQVVKAYNNNTYKLKDMKGMEYPKPTNWNKLKLYYVEALQEKELFEDTKKHLAKGTKE